MKQIRIKWNLFWCAVNIVATVLYASEGVVTMSVLHGIGIILFAGIALYEWYKE